MTIGSEGTRTSLKQKIKQNFEIQEFQVYIIGYIFYSQLSRTLIESFERGSKHKIPECRNCEKSNSLNGNTRQQQSKISRRYNLMK